MAEDKKVKEEVEIPKVEAIPQWALDLQEKVGELKKENEMLKDMAGKNAITSYQDGHLPKEAKKIGRAHV